jgi:23S rRNA (guanosine2251-2'-O)-methyltransferase
VIIPNKRSAHVTAATYKSSAGAVAHIPIVQVPNIARAIEQLQEAGFWAAAASEHATDLVWKTNLKGKIVLIIGNEQEGVSRLVLEKCDFICALPQVGEISSLNAAQASTVFMYEWLRQNVC